MHSNTIISLAVFLFSMSTTLVAADCKEVLELAARNYYSQYSMDDIRAFVYQKSCGEQGLIKDEGVNLGLDTVVKQIPISGSFSSKASKSERKKWCNENSDLKKNSSIFKEINSNVFAPAISSWESCKKASSKNLVTNTTISGDGSIIQTVFQNTSTNDEIINGIIVTSPKIDKIDCKINKGKGGAFVKADLSTQILMERNRSVTLVCTRQETTINANGENRSGFINGSFSVSNALSPYLFSFPVQYTEFPASTEPVQPEKIVVKLDGVLRKSRATWTVGNAGYHDYNSPMDKGPRMDLVVNGIDREENKIARAKGAYVTAPSHCDHSNELCKEYYYQSACLINKVWHNWYKEKVKRDGLSYSKQQVCTQI